MSDDVALPSLQLTGSCNRISIATENYSQSAYLLVELKPSGQFERVPVNLSIVLDCGKTLGGSSREPLKAALGRLIDGLSAQDFLSLVTSDPPARAAIPSQSVGDASELKERLEGICETVAGSLTPGFREGIRQLQANSAPGRMNRMLLVVSRPLELEHPQILLARKEADAAGAEILCLGVGSEWEEEFMLGLTGQKGMPGPLAYAPQATDIGSALQWLSQSLKIVTRNVSLAARFMRGVEVRQVWQVRPAIVKLSPDVIRGHSLVIPVGDLAEEGRSFLVEVELPPRSLGTIRVAHVEVSYHLASDDLHKQAVDVVVNYSQDTSLTNPLDNYVMDFVERVQSLSLRIQALEDLDAGNVPAAAHKFRQAAAILASQGNTFLSDRIRSEVDFNLRQYGQISIEGRKFIRLLGRRAE